MIPGRIEGKGRHRKLLKADYILAVADLGHPEDISKAFAGFQKYLYADKVA